LSEKGKDRLFIAYANYSLREDPKNLLKIYDVYDRTHTSLADFIHKKDLRTKIETIVECEFSKKDFVESVISRKPDPNVRVIYGDLHLMHTIETVYGYRDGFCEHECPLRKIREENWGREPFVGPDRWKCTECDQCDFVRVLMEIMEGIPYSEIDGLLPKPTQKFLEEMLSPHTVTERSGQKLDYYSSFRSRVPSLSSDEVSSKSIFRESWSVLIGTDLEGFLNEDENNWRRLKLCPYCNEFFTAKSVDRKICYSQDCRKAYNREQKRPYMQEKRDPDCPKFKLKYKTREFTKKKPT
jgi:hypothetical protein